jgi:hypothetical protein
MIPIAASVPSVSAVVTIVTLNNVDSKNLLVKIEISNLIWFNSLPSVITKL